MTHDVPREEPSTGELLTRLSNQTSQLIRDELRLVRAEMSEKAKHGGLGAGLFGTAGILALFGLGALTAAAILGLDLVLPAWAAALIVGVAILIVAGIAALIGRSQVKQAGMKPERTIDSVKRDVEEIKERNSR